MVSYIHEEGTAKKIFKLHDEKKEDAPCRQPVGISPVMDEEVTNCLCHRRDKLEGRHKKSLYQTASERQAISREHTLAVSKQQLVEKRESLRRRRMRDDKQIRLETPYN